MEVKEKETETLLEEKNEITYNDYQNNKNQHNKHSDILTI